MKVGHLYLSFIPHTTIVLHPPQVYKCYSTKTFIMYGFKLFFKCFQVHRLQWTNAYKSVRRQNQYDQKRQQQIVHKEVIAAQENMDVPTSRHEVDSFTIPTPPPQPIEQLHQDIISCIYKRVAASSRHCIFGDCRNTERLLVPSVIKE